MDYGCIFMINGFSLVLMNLQIDCHRYYVDGSELSDHLMLNWDEVSYVADLQLYDRWVFFRIDKIPGWLPQSFCKVKGGIRAKKCYLYHLLAFLEDEPKEEVRLVKRWRGFALFWPKFLKSEVIVRNFKKMLESLYVSKMFQRFNLVCHEFWGSDNFKMLSNFTLSKRSINLILICDYWENVPEVSCELFPRCSLWWIKDLINFLWPFWLERVSHQSYLSQRAHFLFQWCHTLLKSL